MATTLTGFARKVGQDQGVVRTRLEEYERRRGGIYVPSGRTIAAEVSPEMLEAVRTSSRVMSRYTIEDGVVTAVDAAGDG